jgi:hypothetical protein
MARGNDLITDRTQGSVPVQRTTPGKSKWARGILELWVFRAAEEKAGASEVFWRRAGHYLPTCELKNGL